ncbi:Baculovirus repeated ORF 4 [Trabala vishnou gigantina nucleopolyhedrovirus]|uniref:Baculovirus repeated ORF 4 n=1 Tax=Trabala vishnou gigantina nucleopolyhedrovirus TaxID=2863583 RepID=UPI002482044A|nr:Baculovirus repeated ORF 4 [Trabala vishnou gigantina nucleopolyhedrovirus]QYC92741.1 Baculovirus repeated ORF 4 [Trabala vishnou gigantina nucleopolyhedrovirus]
MALQRFEFDITKDVDDKQIRLMCWAVILRDGRMALRLDELAQFTRYDVLKAHKLIDEKWKIVWSELKNKIDPVWCEFVGEYELSPLWHPDIVFVFEPGLYALLANSFNKPMGKEKMKYVYETVLPSIRKTNHIRMITTTSKKENQYANFTVAVLEQRLDEQEIILDKLKESVATYELKLAAANKDTKQTIAAQDKSK